MNEERLKKHESDLWFVLDAVKSFAWESFCEDNLAFKKKHENILKPRTVRQFSIHDKFEWPQNLNVQQPQTKTMTVKNVQ